MALLGRDISNRYEGHQSPSAPSGYDVSPIEMYASSKRGNAMYSQTGNLLSIDLAKGLRGLSSIGSFINYCLIYDIAAPAGVPQDVFLSDILGYTFYFRFYESSVPLSDGTYLPPLRGDIPVNGYHFNYTVPSSLPLTNLYPLDLNFPVFSADRMIPNANRVLAGDMIGDCYIAFQEFPNTASYAPTPSPYGGNFVRVYIFRESMILEDMRGGFFNKQTQNWQRDKFLKTNHNNPNILDIPSGSEDHYSTFGLNLQPWLVGDLYGINRSELINGSTPTIDDWLYGRGYAVTHFDSQEPTPGNFEYRVINDGDQLNQSFYFNADRSTNKALSTKDVKEINPTELRIISNNTITNSLSPVERMRFTGTFDWQSLYFAEQPKGTLQIDVAPYDIYFLESIYGYLVRDTSIPSNLTPITKNIALWGDRDSVIVDAWKRTENSLFSDFIAKGTYYNSSQALPDDTFPDWFKDQKSVNTQKIFYGPLKLDDLANLGSSKLQIQFDLDLIGNTNVALGESYRIVIVFTVNNVKDNSLYPSPKYTNNEANSSFAWISPAYKLEVNNEDPGDPDPPTPKPTLRTCAPDVCSYIEDYIKSYPDNLEVSPLDRIRSTVTFFSKKFDQCRTYPAPINVQHHFESGVRQARYRIYWDEYDSNNVPIFRHVVQLGAKTPNFNNPSLPYTGSPELIETVQVYDSNTQTYGFLSLSVDYRIRDEATLSNIVTIQLDANGNELSQTSNPTQTQDWTNKTLYVEFAVDVQFTLLNSILSDTFVKRQILRVIDFDSNKLEANRILKLELTSDDNGANAVVINDLLSTQQTAFVRASQVLDDDDNLINPLDPVQDDYHISLIRKAPFGSATTVEYEEILPNQLQQLQSLPLISSEANFSTAPVPLAFGGFDVQALDQNADYQYAAIKKKHTKDLDDCTDSISASGNPGVYYYPINLGSVDNTKKFIVCSYDMDGSYPDGLRFVHNNKVAFYTQSGDPYTQNYVASADFDLSGMFADWTISIEGLQESGSCYQIEPFEYTFNNYQSISDQIDIFIDQINNSPNALAGKLKAYRPLTSTIRIVWFDVLDTCCGANLVYYKINPLVFPTPASNAVVNCCGPNAELNPDDNYVVPDLVGASGQIPVIYHPSVPSQPSPIPFQNTGVFAYEMSETIGTNCFNLGELLIVSPTCWRGLPTSSAWRVSLHCPMELIPYTVSAYVINNTNSRFTGVINGLYGFLIEAPDATSPFSITITASSGFGRIRAYIQDDNQITFNQPLKDEALGGPSFVINIPARTGFNTMPHVIITVNTIAVLPWSITIN